MLSGAEEAGFAAWWPLADPVVRALLRQHGSRHEDIDDVVQATAEKAWRSSKVFNDAAHFIAWCCTVALNNRVDQWRKTQREVCTDIPECDATDRPDDLAVTLVTRTALLAAIDLLPRAERDAVLGSFEPTSRIEATRFAVARHRGRSKLRDVLKGLSAAFGRFGGDAVKRLARSARRVPANAAIAAVALVGVGALTQLQLTRPVPTEEAPVWRDAGATPLPPSGLAQLDLRPIVEATKRLEAVAGRSNYTPMPAVSLPFLPASDGTPRKIEGRPSTAENPTQHLCIQTAITPYTCIGTGLESIDFWFPPGTPHLPGL